jgi:hypothetical protein
VPSYEKLGSVRPRPLDDVEDFAEALAALRVRHPIRLIGPGYPAAADPEDQPSVAHLIDCARPLSEP